MMSATSVSGDSSAANSFASSSRRDVRACLKSQCILLPKSMMPSSVIAPHDVLADGVSPFANERNRILIPYKLTCYVYYTFIWLKFRINIDKMINTLQKSASLKREKSKTKAKQDRNDVGT